MANQCKASTFWFPVVFLLYQLGTCAAFAPTLGRDLTEAVIGPYQQIDPKQVAKECLMEYARIPTDPAKLIAVVDSIGKPAAGILEGNFGWIGHYDQCTDITDFKYCTVQMQLNGTKVIPGLVLPISWGVCAPMVCSTTDINGAIGLILDLANMSQYFHVNDVRAAATVCEQDPPKAYDAGFIITVFFSSLLILISVFAASLDYIPKIKCQRFNSPVVRLLDVNPSPHIETDDMPVFEATDVRTPNGTPNGGTTPYIPPNRHLVPILNFMQCFSLTNNLSKLLDCKQSDSTISCLNGIRVISMFWVVIGHTFIFSANSGALENPLTGMAYIKRFGFQAIGNAFFAVDTFFLLSGFLLAFLTLSRMAKTKGKIPWFWFYFHRFWRLTPVYMFAIVIWMFLMPFFGQGPFWHTAVNKPFCPKYWWTNLLYINNFWPKAFGDQCLVWSWYLANDMQFFVISPVFLLTIFLFPLIGAIIMFGTLTASFIVTGTLIGYYDLDVHLAIVGVNNAPPLDFNSVVYDKPYCRIAPYLVGIALGYIMYKIRDRKVLLNPIFVAVGWVVAAGLAIGAVYGLYPSYKGEYEMSLASRIIYGTFSRFVWSLAIGWVIFACKYGYGGLVNDFLSWSGWIVPSRLTYTTYLIHPIVILTFYFNFASATHYSMVLLSFYFAGSLVISYGMATILSLIIEYPFANLEKLLMPKNIQSKRTVEIPTKNTTVQ